VVIWGEGDEGGGWILLSSLSSDGCTSLLASAHSSASYIHPIPPIHVANQPSLIVVPLPERPIPPNPRTSTRPRRVQIYVLLPLLHFLLLLSWRVALSRH
jgi:hypothetical protein